jgi:formylglycine-generating enzyme required for sulfatase activity
MSKSFCLGFVAALGLVVAFTVGNAAAQQPEVIKNSLGMKLALVPAGEFMMGAEEDRSDTLNYFPYCDPKWLDGELPRHQVRITKPFYMGQYEVTLGQFLTFYHDAKYKLDIERDGKPSWGYDSTGGKLIESNRFRPWAPGWQIGMDHPVVYVSWNDAVAFCKWLSKKEGKTYRLPTEAEWEYACRAGSNSRYHFGNNPEELVRYGNVADQDRKPSSGTSTIASFDKDGKKTNTQIPFPFVSRRDGYKWTAPVGKFQPNAFGLYDMHGNVWEWCSDWYDENYYGKSPVDDPQGASAGSFRVLRGGGFGVSPVALRCAGRSNVDPASRDDYGGFRVVCER